MVYKRRRLLCATTTDDVRVYQAPPGDGLLKQLAPSGDDVTPSGQVVKWSTYDVPSGHWSKYDVTPGDWVKSQRSNGKGQRSICQ